MILTNMEQEIIRLVGNARYYAARKAEMINKKRGEQSNAETDIDGFGAEFFFAKLINVMPDMFSLGLHLAEIDLVLYSGNTVDVKQTKHTTGRLMVPVAKENKSADIYVLITGMLPKYRFAGWASESEIFDSHNIEDWGYGPTYMLKQDQLHPGLPG